MDVKNIITVTSPLLPDLDDLNVMNVLDLLVFSKKYTENSQRDIRSRKCVFRNCLKIKYHFF